jgi:hypothetical protein
VIEDWTKAFKKGREDFKKMMDDNFSKVESFFATSKMENFFPNPVATKKETK